jgi:hypothetical protein
VTTSTSSFVSILLTLLLLFAARDDEHILLRFDGEIALAEPGDRDRDAVAILAGLFDVARRIAHRGFVEASRQTIKANGGRIAHRGFVETEHVLTESRHAIEADGGTDERR